MSQRAIDERTFLQRFTQSLSNREWLRDNEHLETELGQRLNPPGMYMPTTQSVEDFVRTHLPLMHFALTGPGNITLLTRIHVYWSTVRELLQLQRQDKWNRASAMPFRLCDLAPLPPEAVRLMLQHKTDVQRAWDRYFHASPTTLFAYAAWFSDLRMLPWWPKGITDTRPWLDPFVPPDQREPWMWCFWNTNAPSLVVDLWADDSLKHMMQGQYWAVFIHLEGTPQTLAGGMGSVRLFTPVFPHQWDKLAAMENSFPRLSALREACSAPGFRILVEGASHALVAAKRRLIQALWKLPSLAVKIPLGSQSDVRFETAGRQMALAYRDPRERSILFQHFVPYFRVARASNQDWGQTKPIGPLSSAYVIMPGVHMSLADWNRNLRDILAQEHPIHLLPAVEDLLTGLLDAWTHLQLTHADVKAANAGVVLAPIVSFKWLDMDCMVREHVESKACTTLPDWSQPTVYLTNDETMHWADLFRFGCMLARMLYGSNVLLTDPLLKADVKTRTAAFQVAWKEYRETLDRLMSTAWNPAAPAASPVAPDFPVLPTLVPDVVHPPPPQPQPPVLPLAESPRFSPQLLFPPGGLSLSRSRPIEFGQPLALSHWAVDSPHYSPQPLATFPLFDVPSQPALPGPSFPHEPIALPRSPWQPSADPLLLSLPARPSGLEGQSKPLSHSQNPSTMNDEDNPPLQDERRLKVNPHSSSSSSSSTSGEESKGFAAPDSSFLSGPESPALPMSVSELTKEALDVLHHGIRELTFYGPNIAFQPTRIERARGFLARVRAFAQRHAQLWHDLRHAPPMLNHALLVNERTTIELMCYPKLEAPTHTLHLRPRDYA
jgi:hypothetical protein